MCFVEEDCDLGKDLSTYNNNTTDFHSILCSLYDKNRTSFSRQWRAVLWVATERQYPLFTTRETRLLNPWTGGNKRHSHVGNIATEERESESEQIDKSEYLPECVTPLLSMWEWGRGRSLILAGLGLRGERTGGPVGRGVERDREMGRLCRWSLRERSCL